MRELAKIRRIKDIQPIPNADMIEVATVDGWKVVVAKNVGHKVGDLVVYCEIDSLLPIEPEFEFLRKTSYIKLADGTEGFRLKTIRLRGQISQGLIIPLKDGYSIYERKTNNLTMDWFEGLDVTDMLGIIKYEKPIPAQLSGKIKGWFPSFIPKTDEERVQNLVEEYKEWVNTSIPFEFYVTEKLDGTSATYYYNNGEFGVCSRNLELLEEDTNSFWSVAKQLNLKDKLASLNFNVAVQGELIGEGIQGNPYKIKGQTVRIFNLFDIDTQTKVKYDKFIKIVRDELKLETVPVLFQSGEFELPKAIDEILSFAEGKSQLNPNKEREGIVVRSRDNSISFKVISNKFLIEGGE